MKKFKFLGYEFSPVGYLPEDYTGINNYLVEIPVQLPAQYSRLAFMSLCSDIDPLPSVFRCESGDYAGKIIVPGRKSLYIYSGTYKPLEVTANTDDKSSSATSETPAEPVDSSTETEEAADSPAGTAEVAEAPTAPAETAEPVKANEEAGATAPAIGATEPPAPTTAEKPEAQKEPTTTEKPAEKTEAQKRAEEQAQRERERVAALSPEAAAEEAAKRVKTDTDRLTGHNMRVMVGEHIERKCSDPEFSRLVLQPGKKMERCFRFIMRKAREYAEAEMKALGEQRMGVYGTDVPDDIVYGWAEEYFTTPVTKEDEEDKPKPPAARPTTKPTTKPAKGKEKANGKASADAKSKPEKTTATEKPQEQLQLTLF